MFAQIFLSPQVKRNVIISKNVVHGILNELALEILRNQEIYPRQFHRWAGQGAHTRNKKISRKSQKFIELWPSTQSPPQKMKILSILTKTPEKWKLNFFRSALFHMKTRICLKYFVYDCLWKQFFCYSKLVPVPFKLNFFDDFGNSSSNQSAKNC